MKLFFKAFLTVLLLVVFGLGLLSCESDALESDEPLLIMEFRFNENQEHRTNGASSSILEGNAAQTPAFKSVASSYLELAQDNFASPGESAILFKTPETLLGGTKAVDFGKAKIVSGDEVFLKIPLREIAVGNYNFLRIAMLYQNSDIQIRHSGKDYNGTISSFLGPETYISSLSIGNNFFDVNENRRQGYWAFALKDYPYSAQGTADGTTADPDLLAASSPIPRGPTVVKFPEPLIITGNERKNIVVTVSLSASNSFEWKEINADGKFEPAIGEEITNIGYSKIAASFKKE